MRCQRKACKTVIIDDLPKHQITVDFDWGLETYDYTVVDEKNSGNAINSAAE